GVPTPYLWVDAYSRLWLKQGHDPLTVHALKRREDVDHLRDDLLSRLPSEVHCFLVRDLPDNLASDSDERVLGQVLGLAHLPKCLQGLPDALQRDVARAQVNESAKRHHVLERVRNPRSRLVELGP